MKPLYLASAAMLALLFSCSKEDNELTSPSTPPETEGPKTFTAAQIYNPIVGTWELGMFRYVCPNSVDTITYANERGDFVEFGKTDTAFYTYHTTGATGWTPYQVLDSATFILGDTMHIVSYDGVRLTTYCKSSNGGSQQWMTYKKAVLQ